MRTRHRNTFTTIRTEGALLPPDVLQRIAEGDGDLGGLSPADYHLLAGEKINEAVNRSWNRLLGAWSNFQAAVEKLPAGDPGTTATRERWLLPLFQELGYGRLQTSRALELDGRSFPISHTWGRVPLHLVGCNIELDRRTAGVAGAARSSPHSLVQELLNRSDDHLWALLSNGLRLRILRDNVSLTRQAYVEFDLEAMLQGDVYADFVLLWLLCHQSRVEGERPEAFWLEKWSRAAQEQGTRAREQLRDGVEQAISALGGGFLRHRANRVLRDKLRSGELSTQDYYRQLLRLVYRLIFLFVAEDRDLLFDPNAEPEARERYVRHYSTARLRRLAERRRGGRHHDAFVALRLVMTLLSGDLPSPHPPTPSPLPSLGEGKGQPARSAGGDGVRALGLPVLGSFLFSHDAVADIIEYEIANNDLLDAVRALAFTVDGHVRRPVDYKNLGPEELGSVYESLLELHPDLNVDAGTFALATVGGHERKTTGSYYTPGSLIQVLLDSALDPVIEDRLDGARRMANGEWKDRQEEMYAYSVVSGFGNLAARHVTGGTSVSTDEELSTGGTVRADLPDAPGRRLDSGQHRRGLGPDRDKRIPSLPTDRLGQSTGTGDTPDSLPTSRSMHATSGRTSFGDDDHPGQADSDIDAPPQQEAWELAQRLWNRTPLTTRRQQLAEQALLALKICDPACGSGHFLIAAAHRLARRLAAVRSGEEEPPPEALRTALRDVIGRCIYGVDVNPMAVELCKINLWMEALQPGKPLSFLDNHIKCGNSLIGVGPGLNIDEIPDAAFKPAFGDDKATATALRRRNKRERGDAAKGAGGQLGFRWEVTEIRSQEDLRLWVEKQATHVEAMPEEEARQVQAKAEAYAAYLESEEYLRNRLEYDLWTAAFFWPIPAGDAETMLAPTQQELIQLRAGKQPDAELVRRVLELAERHRFFHWEFEFPTVFINGGGRMANGDHSLSTTHHSPGFDVVLGNPPWETLQLEEKQFFASLAPEIAGLSSSERKKAIKKLPKSNPLLSQEYIRAKQNIVNIVGFVRNSNRFPLTAFGKINTYALFASHMRQALNNNGYAGFIVPTGIATDDNTKHYFRDLVSTHSISSLFDFENRNAIFPAVHRNYKFCLLTISNQIKDNTEFVFFATDIAHIRDNLRRFTLVSKEITLFNPNTWTMPIFRTRIDAELTRKIYNRVSVLINEKKKENPWGIVFKQGLFNMASDSTLFAKNRLHNHLQLYEGKFINQFDHRHATCKTPEAISGNQADLVTNAEHSDPLFFIKSRYWVPSEEVDKRLEDWDNDWLIVFRDVTRAVDLRSCWFSFIPRVGVGHTAPLVFPHISDIKLVLLLIANINSFIVDYVARQKIGGIHMTYGYLKQLPVLTPYQYHTADIEFVFPRVLELSYTAWDMQPFAEDMGYAGPPFRWDESRRALLRAELDAYYARLYGFTRDELRYILDPHDVYGPDFPGETFRVLKQKELKQYGEYRTRRLVLEAWDRMQAALDSGEEYVPMVDPPPADVRVGHEVKE